MVITFITDVSSLILLFWGLVLFITVCGWFTYSVLLCEDSSSTVFKGGFVLHFMDSSIVFGCGFIHCLRADSSTLITGDLSPLY